MGFKVQNTEIGNLWAGQARKAHQRYLVLPIVVLIFFFGIESSHAETVILCSEAQVIEIARNASTQFCAGENGCAFKARLQTISRPINSLDPVETWVVTVSQIHSFDAYGKPKFMPEGAQFVRVGIGKGGCTAPVVSGFRLKPPPPPVGQ